MSSTHRAQHTASQDEQVTKLLNDYMIVLDIVRECEHCKSKFTELVK
jgi:hypothetical protein